MDFVGGGLTNFVKDRSMSGLMVLAVVVLLVIVMVVAWWTCICVSRGPTIPPNSHSWLEYTKTEKYKSQNEKCKTKLTEITELIRNEQLKLLVIGRKGVGKSSFLNTVMRACDESDSAEIEQVFVTAQCDDHVSQRFTGRKAGKTNIFMVDSIGVSQDGKKFTYDKVWDSLFQGKVNVGANIEYIENFDGQDAERHSGTPYDGVILVEDAGAYLGDKTELAFAKKIVQTRARMSAPIPMIGVVTKIDNLCSNFSNFVELTDQKEVTKAVADIQQWLDRPCFPVRCYDDTFKYTDPWINYNALDVLHYIVGLAVKFKQREAQEN